MTSEVFFIPQLDLGVVLADVHENLVHRCDLSGRAEPMAQRQNVASRENSWLGSTVRLGLDNTVPPLQQPPELRMKGETQLLLQLSDLSSRCRRPKCGVIRWRPGGQPRLEPGSCLIKQNKIHRCHGQTIDGGSDKTGYQAHG
ncbi:hypothetical protein N4G66_40480 [Streptomyces rhizosphaerihabitans]|nr:hypothetical protein [Streptomyces rhizosphaerihabitans]MCT9010995.1 hypothetical protein [Streptomyces rhizosphaerihabitans]